MSDTQQQQGPQEIVFQGFSTLNTQPARPAIKDDQCAWMDGFMPVGESTARTMYDVGTPLFTAGAGLSISWFDFCNIQGTPYCLAFLSNGSIQAINTNTSVVTQICAPGVIANPALGHCGISQFGATFVIIVSNQSSGYFLWDGTTFYGPGASVPNYGTAPTGVSGTAVEVYAGRVWVANGAGIEFSAPQSITDFSSADGGGTFQSSDSFLRADFISLKQTNGFLYLIGDSSINYISGVTTGGSPTTTTFSNQNADPETGTPYAATVDVFNRNILFANAFGAHISYGGAVTKISDVLDGIYNSVKNFGGQPLSAAKAIVFGQRIWMLLVPIIDAVTGQQTNKLCCWNGQKWWTTQQSVALTYVQHQEINSVLTAYGTNGKIIYPLFQTPSTAFTKTLQSKLFAEPGGLSMVKSANRLWGVAQYFSNNSPGLNVSIDNENGSAPTNLELAPNEFTWTNDFGVTMTWVNNSGQPILWLSPGGVNYVVFPPTPMAQNGVLLGFTVTTNCADVALIAMSMATNIVQYRG